MQWSAPPLTLPDREPILVHVIEGQHFASFDANSQRAFFDTVWRVAPESNRMGFRLSGPPLGRPQADEILSGPDLPGHGAGAAERRADRADGRSPDHRRLSAHRRDRLGRRGAARAARARRQGALRALQPGDRRASCASMRGSGCSRRCAASPGSTARNEDDRPQLRHGRELRRLEDGRRRRGHAAHHLGQHRLRLPRRRPGDHPQDGAPRGRPRRGDRRASVASGPPGLRPPAR